MENIGEKNEYPFIKPYKRRIFIRYDHWGTSSDRRCRRFFTSGQTETLHKGSLWDTTAQDSLLLGVIGISILPVSGHERARWWAQCLAEDSQFKGRRARWTRGAAHQSAATQRRLGISWPATAPLPPLLWLSFGSSALFFQSCYCFMMFAPSALLQPSTGGFCWTWQPFQKRKTLPKRQLSVFVWEERFFLFIFFPPF